ncbi:MAG TPA: DNA primase, partial [Thermodesulfobacteriota bacterium]|nr:DNA primase [Thermodesulfobacteriota bacterium]
AAREHLAARGVAEATAEAFGLGYAPAAWDALVRHLAAQGYRPELVARAGLAVARPQGGGYYDRFRDRLMIPIADAQGRVVAFGGRALAAGQEPKYLNSAESPVYRKGELLYGLPQAREAIRRADQAVVVEGYFDCIGLHQAGVREAVATCGTALTASQVRLLTRYARRVVTLFDGDEAGLRAAERALPLFLEAELAARIARLPPGEDPDTFVRRRGAGALRELLARAVPLFEAVVDAWARREDTGTAEGKVRVVRAAAPLFERIADRFVRDEYARILAERLGVLGDDAGEELIRRHLPRWRPARAAGPGGPSGGTPAGRPASARWREAAGDCLIRAVLVAPAFAAELVAGPALAELGDPAVSAIVGAVAGLVRQEGAAAVTVGRLAAALDDERARARVSRVAVTLDELGLDEVSARRQGEDAVRRIHERHLSAEHGRLVEAIARARAEGAPLDELAPLLERAGAIMHEMKGLAPYSGP